MNAEALCELKCWEANLQEYNSQPLWHEPGTIKLCSWTQVIKVLEGMLLTMVSI